MIRKTGFVFWACVLFGLVHVEQSAAQANVDSIPRPDSIPLAEGAWIKVLLTASSEFRGRLLGQPMGSLMFQPQGLGQDSLNLQLAEVSQVWAKSGSRALPGLILGAAMGLAIGKAYVLAVCQGEPGDRCTSHISSKAYVGIGTGLGSLFGLVVGAAMPRWRLISF